MRRSSTALLTDLGPKDNKVATLLSLSNSVPRKRGAVCKLALYDLCTAELLDQVHFLSTNVHRSRFSAYSQALAMYNSNKNRILISIWISLTH